jgi:casein kinase II subunit beta
LDDSLSSSGSSLQSWISWFCSLSGHEYYAEVPEDFIDDEFNLTGLSTIVPYYNQALETILDMECGEFFDDDDEEEEEEEEDQQDEYDLTQIENYYNNTREDDDFWKEDDKTPKRLKAQYPRIVEPYAFMLYGLIHQRYLLTRNGLRLMAERYSNSQFGTCPRYYCNESPVLPMGQFDETGRESVHLYCPRCLDIYSPPSSIHRCVDGKTFFFLNVVIRFHINSM